MNHHGEIIKKDKVASPKNNYDAFLHLFFSIIDLHKKGIIGVPICCPGIIRTGIGKIQFDGSFSYLDDKNLVAEIPIPSNDRK